MPNIMKAVQFMIDTANDNTHGYDQTHRNGPDYDCSSLVGTALHEAGFNVSPYSWTGNLEAQLRKAGFVDCKAPWLPGDVHLKAKHHVVMSISNSQIAHASINEKGTVTGGKTGDQTGKEICIRDYYEYSGGWDVHLRYAGQNTEVAPDVSIDTIAREVIAGKWGNGDTRKKLLTEAGYDYGTVQAKVNALMSGKELKSNGEIAREVIAGKWGNGNTRKQKLTAAGYDYDTVQAKVNALMGYDYGTLKAKVNTHMSGKELKSNGEIAREVIAGKWGNGNTRKQKLTAAGYDYSAIQKLVNQMLA